MVNSKSSLALILSTKKKRECQSKTDTLLKNNLISITAPMELFNSLPT